MKKEIDGCVVEKSDGLVTITRITAAGSDLLMSIWHQNDQIELLVHDAPIGMHVAYMTIGVLRTALEMLAEPEKTDGVAPGQATCRDCVENPNTVGSIPTCPAQTFCQAARTPLIDLKSQCPLLMAPADLRELCQHHRQGDELDEGKSLCLAYAGEEDRECKLKSSKDLTNCLDFQTHVVET